MRLVETYALAEMSSGALLLDLSTGAAFELNDSAALIWERILAGSNVEEAALALSTKYGLPGQVALDDTRSALRLSLELVTTPPTDFKYSKIERGYSFSFCGNPVFEVDSAGDRLTPIMENIGDDSVHLRYLLRALAPKLLALRGETVLHASAVELGGRVVAFCGISGAGKTTTARALVKVGARPVAEDQLIVRQLESQVFAAIDGEQAVSEWLSDATAVLARGKTESIDLARISQCTFGPLSEIGFIDKNDRTDGGFVTKAFTPVGTAGAVFRNAFYGSDRSDDWIRHLKFAASIGQRVLGMQVRFPDGLDLLAKECVRIAAERSIRPLSAANRG